VKSTARLFGDLAKRWVGGFYLATVLLAAAACLMRDQPLASLIVGLSGVLAFGLHLAGQVLQIPVNGLAKDPLALFKSNKTAGLILVVGLMVQALVGWILSLGGLG
jgi:4-hydroxybenzoate polyprenyltransferase